jgi:ATP-dependent Clp protease ATP-binding subunit ClpB
MQREYGIVLGFSERAMDWLADEGFHPEFGARPLKRLIQRSVLNKLSDALLLDQIQPNSHAILDVFDGTVVFRQPNKV